MLVTTTTSVEGRRIVAYHGVVSGEAIFGAQRVPRLVRLDPRRGRRPLGRLREGAALRPGHRPEGDDGRGGAPRRQRGDRGRSGLRGARGEREHDAGHGDRYGGDARLSGRCMDVTPGRGRPRPLGTFFLW